MLSWESSTQGSSRPWSLMAITLTGAYGKSISAVFTTSGAGVAAVAKAAKAEKVSPAGAKTAYNRAPYKKPVLKYLYAMGWIGGTKNAGQCGLDSPRPGCREGAGGPGDACQHEARHAAEEALGERLGRGERRDPGRRLGLRLVGGLGETGAVPPGERWIAAMRRPQSPRRKYSGLPASLPRDDRPTPSDEARSAKPS